MIYLTDITQDYVSGIAGLNVGRYLDKQLSDTGFETPINVSFKNIDMITPSFVNGAFLYLIDLYGYDIFKEYVKMKEVKIRVGEILKSCIQGYTQQKDTFLSTLKTNKIYCAIDGSSIGVDFRYKLFQATQNKGFDFYFNPNDATFSNQAKEAINQSEVCIGIIPHQKNIDNIFIQVNYALQQDKPCLLLCNQNVQIHIPIEIRGKVKINYYNSQNYYSKIKEINQLLFANKRQIQTMTRSIKKTERETDLLLWGGAALLLTGLVLWAGNDSK